MVDDLSKEVDSFKILEHYNNKTTGHFPVKVDDNKETKIHNLSVALTRLVHDVGEHGQKLSQLVSFP